jgi:CBS domain-containing protein
MRVGDKFERDAVAIGAFENLTTAAQLMREKNVGFLVVVEPGFDNQLKPIGVLTNRDIVKSVVAREADSRSLRVEDAMSGNPLVTQPADELLEIARRMRRLHVRQAPVVGALGELIGVLSLDDILDGLADERRENGDAPLPSGAPS